MKKCLFLLMLSIFVIGCMYSVVDADIGKFEVINHYPDNKVTKMESIGAPEVIENEILSGMIVGNNYSFESILSCNELISPFSLADGKGLIFLSNVEPTPYCQINKIVSSYDFDNGKHIEVGGTGFMVGPGIVVTAAHCIYYDTYEKWPDQVRVYVKQNGSVENCKYYTPHSWIIPSEYFKHFNRDYDWAILTMRENISEKTGWMGIGYTTDEIINKEITVSGYPGDSKYMGHQCCSKGYMDWDSAYQIRHTADTLPGQSGGPIFDNDNITWGIHTHKRDNSNYQYGTRFTMDLYSLLKQK
ncbi:MAG: trypsin-like serine protease, partial [Lachnospiraceae bacterium]|nr:trypsin-like serine protease [Lachnospiraceae bacterium]